LQKDTYKSLNITAAACFASADFLVEIREARQSEISTCYGPQMRRKREINGGNETAADGCTRWYWFEGRFLVPYWFSPNPCSLKEKTKKDLMLTGS